MWKSSQSALGKRSERRSLVKSRLLWLGASLFVGPLALTVHSAHAQDYATNGYVTITSMGCGMTGTTACWVNVSGSPAGPAGCNTTSFRWDPSSSPNGNVTLAQLTAAFVAGKTVFFVLNDTCWSAWNTYPTLWYYQISQ
jgi:hypothetical protein